MSHPIGSGLTLNALNWPTTSGRKRTSVRGCAAESAALATIATAIQHTCARYVMSDLRFMTNPFFDLLRARHLVKVCTMQVFGPP
jgi:hypothetical protein